MEENYLTFLISLKIEMKTADRFWQGGERPLPAYFAECRIETKTPWRPRVYAHGSCAKIVPMRPPFFEVYLFARYTALVKKRFSWIDMRALDKKFAL